MQVLVLGLGNILLSDEGIGVRVVEWLSQRFQFGPEVELMDGGTAGMELLVPMAGCDLVVIVDAVRTGRPAGTVVVLRDEEVPHFFRTKLSPHQVHLAEVLATLDITGETPDEVVVVGIEPLSLATGLELSAPVAARLEELAHHVLSELARHDLAPQPLTHRPRSLLLEAGAFAV